jgi:hypothetical protein
MILRSATLGMGPIHGRPLALLLPESRLLALRPTAGSDAYFAPSLMLAKGAGEALPETPHGRRGPTRKPSPLYCFQPRGNGQVALWISLFKLLHRGVRNVSARRAKVGQPLDCRKFHQPDIRNLGHGEIQDREVLEGRKLLIAASSVGWPERSAERRSNRA